MSSRPLGRWLFGKLPILGDFVARGLDYGLRDSLDAWLSDEMEAGRAQFGEEFEARYDCAPAWCFVDRDPQGLWCGGALCASVDAAGRRFPVMLAQPAEDASDAAVQAGGCLEAIYAAFAEGWDADRLHSSAVATVELPWQPVEPSWALIDEQGPVRTYPGRFPAGVIATMMELAA